MQISNLRLFFNPIHTNKHSSEDLLHSLLPYSFEEEDSFHICRRSYEDDSNIRHHNEKRALKVLCTKHFKYVGEMVNSHFDGFGICKYSNGNVYIGEWQMNTKEGYGKVICKDGTICQGEIKRNVYDGYCEVYNKSQNIHVAGIATQGQFMNEVIIEIDDTVMEGVNIREALNQGIWKITNQKTGVKYYGEYRIINPSEIESAYGIYSLREEYTYMGEIQIREGKEFRRSGYGEIYYPDSTKFFGFFDNDNRTGLGLYMYPDDKMLFGLYVNDQQNGPFFQCFKSSTTMKMEMHHLGFKSKSVEKYEVIRKYIEMYYPEYSNLLQLNYKSIMDILLELTDDECKVGDSMIHNPGTL